MIQTIAIHGRQPALGRVELESLYGATALTPLTDTVTGLTIPPNTIAFQRLGGTVKLAKALTVLPTTQFADAVAHISKTLPDHLGYVPDGKIQFGLSVYGLRTNVRELNAAALSIKKVIRAAGRSVRIIPNKELALNSAQVLHNHLTGPTGMELLLIRVGSETYLAQTVHEQDIEAYAARDQARPKRDAKVGMLPPKLAQTIVNLAVGDRNPNDNEIHLLDPFCGTGVVLQEALLMGMFVMGSDLEPRMIEYTQANLDWLRDRDNGEGMLLTLEVGDATGYNWISTFDTIACETYLGRPFSSEPKPDVLQAVMQDVNTIHKKFLQHVAQHPNVRAATDNGREFRMCLAVPAWKTKNGFKHLPVLDHLTDMGYTRQKFVHVSNEDLIYHRENQVVARELVVLVRK